MQGVILREWQGITFMMLDILNTFDISLSTVIQVLYQVLTYDMYVCIFEFDFWEIATLCIVKKDCRTRQLNQEDAIDNGKWRKLIKDTE